MNISQDTGDNKIVKDTMIATSKKLIAALAFIILAFTSFFLPACKRNSSAVYGTYKIYSDDPAVRMFITGQDNYIKLNDDQTIIYHTTINDKPKFHIEGAFTLDKKSDEITVQWKSGKLPGKLKIEKQGEDYVIKIGSTLYKKEKAGS